MTTPVATHPDLSTDALVFPLRADSTLMNLEVAVINDSPDENASATVPRKLAGIFRGRIPQDDSGGYPAGVVGPPVLHDKAAQMHPNGPWRAAADFLVELMFWFKDINPDDEAVLTQCRAFRTRAEEVLEAQTVDVIGGRAISITIHDWLGPRMPDRGTEIYYGIGTKFLVAVQQT